MVSKLNRRDFCGNLRLLALLSPVMALHRNVAFGADNITPRLFLMFSPNGQVMVDGPASGDVDNFTIGDFWTPLERHKADANFLKRMSVPGMKYGSSDFNCGHTPPLHSIMTGRPSNKTGSATGPSLDYHVANLLRNSGQVSPQQSLLWGLGKSDAGPWYEAAGKRASVELNPLAAFQKLVGTANKDDSLDFLKKRRSILDTVFADCKSLVPLMGKEGKDLLDFHCDNIRSLELSVAASLEQSEANTCTVPSSPNTSFGFETDWNNPETYDEKVKIYVDLLALAFQCNLTQVVGFQFDGTAGRFQIPSQYNIPQAPRADSTDSGPAHHAWSHYYSNDAVKREALGGFYRFYSETMAKFADKLKATKDASGKTLLDQTLMLWMPELGGYDNGINPHNYNGLSSVLLGNSGGAIKTNQNLNGLNQAENTHALYVSLIQHMGFTNEVKFGDPASPEGRLEALYR